MPNTGSGRLGEQLTAEYLEEKGYEIVERNFKCRFGEIDVIAQNDRYLAFVEVKTRSADGLSHPFEAITPSSARRSSKRHSIISSTTKRICSRALTPLPCLPKTER